MVGEHLRGLRLLANLREPAARSLLLPSATAPEGSTTFVLAGTAVRLLDITPIGQGPSLLLVSFGIHRIERPGQPRMAGLLRRAYG
jgi:hypothetical protein